MIDLRAKFEEAIQKGPSNTEAAQHLKYMRDLERDDEEPELYAYHATQFAWELWQTASQSTGDTPSADEVRDALQAKIDALMLEYCPDEMTTEQIADYAKHQLPFFNSNY